MIPKNLQATRRLQTPTLIGCSLLMNHNSGHPSRPLSTTHHPSFLNPAAISRASYYDTVFGQSSKFFLTTHKKPVNFPSHPREALSEHAHRPRSHQRTKRPAPALRWHRAFGLYKSLTMTYFHTGIRTIIGAKSFHCPVRDGKEWYQLAMVVRHNGLPH